MFTLLGSLFFYIAFVFVACAGLACANFEKAQRQAELHLEIGANNLRAGQKPQALGSLLQALKLDPKNSRVHDQLGVVYFLMQQHAKAIYHSNRAVQLEPTNTDARLNLGRIYVERSEYVKALRHLRKAAQDLTYNAQHKVWLNMGLAYFYQNQYNRALTALDKARAYRANCVNSNWQARALYALKLYARSIQAYDRAMLLCHGTAKAESQYWKGMSYYRLRRLPEAQLHFSEAMRTAPKSNYAQRAARRLKGM